MANLIKINDTYVNLDAVAAIRIEYHWNYSKPYCVYVYTGSGTVKEELTHDEGKHIEALLKEQLS